MLKSLIKFFISLAGVYVKALVCRPEFKRPDRIAVLLWGGIGNHILFSPALYAIRNRFPKSEIAICAFHHFAEELFARTGDRFLTIGENPSVRSIHRMLFLIRQFKPDAVISNAMSPTFLSSLVAYLSGARIRIGIDRYCRGCLNNIRVKEKKGHEVVLNQSLAESLTDAAVDARLQIDFSDNDAMRAKQAFGALFATDSGKPCIAIQPGSGRMQAFKRWEKEKYRDLIEKLLLMGARIVVLGTEEEREEISFIRASVDSEHLKFLTTNLSLSQITLFLAYTDLVVANDTSLVHLAAVNGVPSVVIYGPTDPVKNEPWDVSSRIVRKEMECAPCYRYATPHCRLNYRCLRDISVGEVFDAVKEMLREKVPQVSKLDINQLRDE